MMPARTVGAGRARGAQTARDASTAPDDQPAWLADVKVGFAGRVVDAGDRPLAGALVVAVAVISVPLAASVGAAGTRAAGGATADRDRRASASETAPALAAHPVAAGPLFSATTDEDGRFSLPVLPPGHYTLFALHQGPPPASSEPIDVDGGFLSVPLRLVISGPVPVL
ncbi:MAG TPA: carboxypeptidase-like regulatory domain-containing protein [Kofleriaceae bacterium]|nr:carboxypeptidase-like regulatory domain-containing protein [Kofleriaceae bacterium]